MSSTQSDALVFFGATGDLAYKKVFPAIQTLIQHGHLDMPIVGVAKAGWGLEQFQARARDSLEKHGGVDEAAFAKLVKLLRYVDGDYHDPATFAQLRAGPGWGESRPLHYLAIPPSLFGIVAEHLAASGCAQDARVVVEKPFGRDLPRPPSSTRSCIEHSRSRGSSASTITWARSRCSTSCFFGSPTSSWSRSGTGTASRASRSRWPKASASRGAAPFMKKPARSAT